MNRVLKISLVMMFVSGFGLLSMDLPITKDSKEYTKRISPEMSRKKKVHFQGCMYSAIMEKKHESTVLPFKKRKCFDAVEVESVKKIKGNDGTVLCTVDQSMMTLETVQENTESVLRKRWSGKSGKKSNVVSDGISLSNLCNSKRIPKITS